MSGLRPQYIVSKSIINMFSLDCFICRSSYFLGFCLYMVCHHELAHSPLYQNALNYAWRRGRNKLHHHINPFYLSHKKCTTRTTKNVADLPGWNHKRNFLDNFKDGEMSGLYLECRNFAWKCLHFSQTGELKVNLIKDPLWNNRRNNFCPGFSSKFLCSMDIVLPSSEAVQSHRSWRTCSGNWYVRCAMIHWTVLHISIVHCNHYSLYLLFFEPFIKET